jgi:hypothetical protein
MVASEASLQLREQLVEAVRAGNQEVIQPLAAQYQALLGDVEGLQGFRERVQVAVILEMGLIAEEAGNKALYLENLSDALEYATQCRLNPGIIQEIEEAIAAEEEVSS